MRVSIFSALNLIISLQPSIGYGSASVNPTRRELVLWLSQPRMTPREFSDYRSVVLLWPSRKAITPDHDPRFFHWDRTLSTRLVA